MVVNGLTLNTYVPAGKVSTIIFSRVLIYVTCNLIRKLEHVITRKVCDLFKKTCRNSTRTTLEQSVKMTVKLLKEITKVDKRTLKYSSPDCLINVNQKNLLINLISSLHSSS